MIYELHITVDHNAPGFRLANWQDFCEDIGVKPLDIRLAAPAKHDRQVMFAAVYEGDGPANWWGEIASQVRESGFVILREKLEVPLDKSAPFTDVPYHEAHIKSLIRSEDVDRVVEELCDRGWMASYNDLFKDDAGREKWYFTWRAYSVDFLQAGREFAESYASLTEICWDTVRMESETVIYDSNPDLDEGWS